MLLKSEGGGEEGADLDDEAQETQDPRTENTASPEKKKKEEARLAGARQQREPRRLDADPHRENGDEPRGTQPTRRQRSSPRRQYLNGSGVWRGGEEQREGEGGSYRPWISAGKRARGSFPLPARARQSRAQPPQIASASTARAWPRRNENLERMSRARREKEFCTPRARLPI